jgi:hypothetical protein
MPTSFSHNFKDSLNKFERRVGMKKIAHRIDKDLPRLIPPQRLVKNIGL